MFQTLKSLVRKREYTQSTKINTYQEQIKYYFENTNTSNDFELLDRILNITNLTDNENIIYTDIKDKLFELVYNIKYNEINIQNATDVESENVINVDTKNDQNTYIKFDVEKLDSFNLYLINDIYKNIEKFAVEINRDNIYILLNLFSLTELVGYSKKTFVIEHNYTYKKNPQFLFAYSNFKLIIVSDNMIRYLYDKYILLNLKLEILNMREIIHLVTDEVVNYIEKCKNFKFIKMFDMHNDEIDTYHFYTNEMYIFLTIFLNMNILSIAQSEWINRYRYDFGTIKQYTSKFLKEKYDKIDSQYKLIEINAKKIRLGGGYNGKYIKYIKKYNAFK